jgi:hypothetical protein
MPVNTNQQAVRDYLRTVQFEAMKLYRVYDGSNRLQYQYDAPTWTANGDTCMRTEYVYDGSSSRIQKMEETLQSWDSSWDI